MKLSIKHDKYEQPLCEIDLYRILAFIPDSERLDMVSVICENIKTDGLIDRIRAVVNNPALDD